MIPKLRVIGIGAVVLVLFESLGFMLLNLTNPPPAEVVDYVLPFCLVLVVGSFLTYVSWWVLLISGESWNLKRRRMNPDYEGDRVESLKYGLLVVGAHGIVGLLIVMSRLLVPGPDLVVLLGLTCYAILLWILAAGIGVRAGIAWYRGREMHGETKEMIP